MLGIKKKKAYRNMSKIPKLKVFFTEDLWIKGLKKSFDLGGLIPLYLYVSKNNINNIENEWNNENTKIKFSVLNNIITVKDIVNLEEKDLNMQICPKEHFWVKGFKRSFDLSGLITLYLDLYQKNNPISNNKREWNIGRATIIYSVDNDDTIHLISGWAGNRNKKAVA